MYLPLSFVSFYILFGLPHVYVPSSSSIAAAVPAFSSHQHHAELAVIGYLSTTFSGVIQQMMMVNPGPSQRTQHDACVAILSRPSTIQLVTRIVEDIYVTSQLEISRAKGNKKPTELLAPDKSQTRIKDHRVYILFVQAIRDLLSLTFLS